MTEVEAATLSAALLANATDTYTIFLTLVTGYLIVAHVAGKTLSRGQLTLITALYLLVTSFTLFVWFGHSRAGIYYQGIVAQQRGSTDYGGDLMAIFGVGLNLLVALAPLKYMRDQRR